MSENSPPEFIENCADHNTAERDYSTLPDIMVMTDGSAVRTAEVYEQRKDEIIELFQKTIFGEIPALPNKISFKVLEKDDQALNGTTIRKQIEIKISTEFGESRALMLLYLPKSDQPVPTFIGLNFKGNHTVFGDPVILPSFSTRADQEIIEEERGVHQSRWPVEEILDRGYGIATIFCDDFAPDNREDYSSRWISVFSDPDNGDQVELKAINTWAFGLMRGIDYLETDPTVDPRRLISIGHSRLGKTSLWAGVQDERIDLVISNDSGNTGAALSRSHRGETVASIQAFFPYWFIDEYKQYGKNEDALPLDQHMLLASIAPRKLYVASATEDLWADPESEFSSLVFASEGFEIYGFEPFTPEGLPPAGEPILSENLAYHIREGKHDITLEDWQFFIDFADRSLPSR